MAAVWLNW